MEDAQVPVQASTPTDKNVRTCFFLTPSALDICIRCHEDITLKYPNDKDKSNKKRLWKKDGQKTKACQDLETLLGKEISKYKDFQSICQSCHNKVVTNLKFIKKTDESFEAGRAEVAEKFLRTRTKRASFDEPPSKKMLFQSTKSISGITGISEIKVCTLI